MQAAQIAVDEARAQLTARLVGPGSPEINAATRRYSQAARHSHDLQRAREDLRHAEAGLPKRVIVLEEAARQELIESLYEAEARGQLAESAQDTLAALDRITDRIVSKHSTSSDPSGSTPPPPHTLSREH